MKQTLLADIELDVHELKYLMDSFSKEPTQTLSELLKRNILRTQERLEQLSQEVDAVHVEPLSYPKTEECVVIDECVVPFIKEELPELEEIGPTAIEKPIIEQPMEQSIEKIIEDSIVIEDIYTIVEKEESSVIEQEYKSLVLGENIKLPVGLRQSISLNDSFRFTREIFGGDSELMNRVVEQISVMSSYKTAVAFLSSKVNINEENEAMMDFWELLKKYFNQSV